MARQAKTHDEASMLRLLAERYGQEHGNGPAYAFVTGVRNAAGFSATRTADAMAMCLWPSRGLLLHGFEVKVSRSDWLRELKDPGKADPVAQYCDRWWLVVSDEAIVQPGELPTTWGLLAVKGKKLACVVDAPPLKPKQMTRNFLAPLLRAAVQKGKVTPEAIQAAVDAAVEKEREYAEQMHRHSSDELARLKKTVRTFEQHAGVRLDAWLGEQDAERFGDVLRRVIKGEVTAERIEERIKNLRSQAQSIAEHADKLLAPDTEKAF